MKRQPHSFSLCTFFSHRHEKQMKAGFKPLKRFEEKKMDCNERSHKPQEYLTWCWCVGRKTLGHRIFLPIRISLSTTYIHAAAAAERTGSGPSRPVWIFAKNSRDPCRPLLPACRFGAAAGAKPFLDSMYGTLSSEVTQHTVLLGMHVVGPW